MPPDRGSIFLSAAREDRSLATQVVEFLRALGWEVFWDMWEPTGSSPTELVVRRQRFLEHARFFIPLLSQSFYDSRHGEEELRFALQNSRTIVPCIVSGDAFPNRFIGLSPWFAALARRQYFDLRDHSSPGRLAAGGLRELARFLEQPFQGAASAADEPTRTLAIPSSAIPSRSDGFRTSVIGLPLLSGIALVTFLLWLLIQRPSVPVISPLATRPSATAMLRVAWSFAGIGAVTGAIGLMLSAVRQVVEFLAALRIVRALERHLPPNTSV